MRSADGEGEPPLATYAYFADGDPLTAAVLERTLAGVSTRRYRGVQEPVGEQVEAVARSRSKSAVSREFVARRAGWLKTKVYRGESLPEVVEVAL
jgi:putative transposase